MKSKKEIIKLYEALKFLVPIAESDEALDALFAGTKGAEKDKEKMRGFVFATHGTLSWVLDKEIEETKDTLDSVMKLCDKLKRDIES